MKTTSKLCKIKRELEIHERVEVINIPVTPFKLMNYVMALSLWGRRFVEQSDVGNVYNVQKLWLLHVDKNCEWNRKSIKRHAQMFP